MSVSVDRPDLDSASRDRALRRLKKRREFQGHLLAYLLFNSCVVMVWFVTGGHGFFWPVFPIAFWGFGVAMNAWEVFHAADFSEAEIQREMRKFTP
jgi:hypothetical protein